MHKSPATYRDVPLACGSTDYLALRSAIGNIDVEQSLSNSIGSKLSDYNSWMLGLSPLTLSEAEAVILGNLSQLNSEFDELNRLSQFILSCPNASIDLVQISEQAAQKQQGFADFKKILASKQRDLNLAKRDFESWNTVAADFSTNLTYSNENTQIKIDGFFRREQGTAREINVLFTISALSESHPTTLYPNYIGGSNIQVPSVKMFDSAGSIFLPKIYLPSSIDRDSRDLHRGEVVHFSVVFTDTLSDSVKEVYLEFPIDFLGGKEAPRLTIPSSVFSIPSLLLTSLPSRAQLVNDGAN